MNTESIITKPVSKFNCLHCGKEHQFDSITFDYLSFCASVNDILANCHIHNKEETVKCCKDEPIAYGYKTWDIDKMKRELKELIERL